LRVDIKSVSFWCISIQGKMTFNNITFIHDIIMQTIIQFEPLHKEYKNRTKNTKNIKFRPKEEILDADLRPFIFCAFQFQAK